MAEVILAVAVNKAGVKSQPFKMYQTKPGALKGQFVLKVSDAPANENGFEQIKVGNFALHLVGTHGKEYMEEKLAGFRRKVGDDVFIMAEKFSEDMADKKAMEAADEF